MTRPAKLILAILVTVTLASCGREGTPTGPSGQTSFLTGTWRGTVTIQVNPGDPNPPPPSSGDMTWTFEVVPQTNMQSLRATIRSTHPWLTMETTGSTALSPGNGPPRRSAHMASSIHRAVVEGLSAVLGQPRRLGSMPTSPGRTVSWRRSRYVSC